MAPLKTMCDEGSLFKYFSYSYLVRVFTPSTIWQWKRHFSEKKELPAGKYMYASSLCVLGSFRSDQYKFNANNVSFRGVYGHWHGKLPWWIIEDFVLSESAKIVGKYSCSSTCVNFGQYFIEFCIWKIIETSKRQWLMYFITVDLLVMRWLCILANQLFL